MRQKYNISPTHLPLQPPYSQNSFGRFHEISCIKENRLSTKQRNGRENL